MKKLLDLERKALLVKNFNAIIFRTDRYSISDSGKITPPYILRAWRKNDWCNHEGKAIKNSVLLDKLDKLRLKVHNKFYVSVYIEYIRRKFNKQADKLSRTGQRQNINRSISIPGLKVIKRKYNGDEIDYRKLNSNSFLKVRVYKKEKVGNQYEVCVEICEGQFEGKKAKIYTDHSLERKLNRGNTYTIKLQIIGSHHVTIFRTFKKHKLSF